MFMGVHQFRYAGRVTSYEEALAVLDKYSRTPKRNLPRERKPYGYHLGMNHNYGVTWVRKETDDSVCFRLYDTDVVSWNPDNSVTIENWGSVTTSDFARQFLPPGISLRHESRNGGDRGITFRSGEAREVTSSWGSYTTYEHSICFGSAVTFEEQGDVWLPRLDTCNTFAMPHIERAPRDWSKRYNLKDFENWTTMASVHMRLEHEGWDADTCADALQRRDFRTAACHMPSIEINDRAWGMRERIRPLPIVTRRGDAVTPACFQKLRMALLCRDGYMRATSHTTLPLKDYEKGMGRVRQLRKLGAIGWETYGG